MPEKPLGRKSSLSGWSSAFNPSYIQPEVTSGTEAPMLKIFSRFWLDQRGAVALEYAVIGAFASILIIAGLKKLGSNLSTTFYGKAADAFP
jgi:pilus assembly protein Flp/PilA